jgi:hypothetical protein
LLIAESARATRKQRLRVHVARRKSLYARAVNAADYRTALAVLADLAKLEGLYPNPAEDLKKQLDELEKQLEELESELAAGRLPGSRGPSQEGLSAERFAAAATP